MQKALKKITIAFITGSVALALFSCSAGNGDGLDENGHPLTVSQSQNGGDDTDNSSNGIFNKIQNEILTPECATSGCHNGTTSPLGLNLIEGKAYGKLVDKSSNQVDGLLLVEASNVDASYLIHKLEGTQGGGAQMPLGKPPLSADQVSIIKTWISAGALKPEEDDEEPDKTLKATLSDIQKNIFDSKCTACHSGENPAGTLSLETGRSFAQLVGRALQFDPESNILVVAGDAVSSFLINKLTGENLGNVSDVNYKGQRMPLNGPYLDSPSVQVIRDWINAGAQDN